MNEEINKEEKESVSDVLDNYIHELIGIVGFYGKDNQKIKAIEELSELQKELCKSFITDNYDKISEEMADCYVMLEQLMIIYGNKSQVKDIIKQKIKRTIKQINSTPSTEKKE